MDQGTCWSGHAWGRWHNDPTLPAAGALILALVIAGLLAPTTLADPTAEAPSDISGYTGRPVVFEGVGTPDPQLRIILYEWDFDGDGVFDWNSTLGGSTTTVFPEPLEATAVMRVTEYNGSVGGLVTATDTTHVRILSGKPTGKVGSSTRAEVDTDFNVVAEFTDPDGGVVTYFWDLDDGSTSDEQSFTHRFRELRKYNITLTVVDDEGESSHAQLILVVVKDLPTKVSIPTNTLIILAVAAGGLLSVAFLSYRSIRSQGTGRTKGEAAHHDVAPSSGEGPVMPEARLQEASSPEVAPVRVKPRVVTPQRAVRTPVKAKAILGEDVPAAPPRPPCPECATTLDDEGDCPFCTANEAIDTVERRVLEMKDEGYVLAEVEDGLEAAKAALHVKNYLAVSGSLSEARTAIEEAQRDHDRGERLLRLIDELVEEARSRDIDTTKAANLLKLSRSFLRSGKYPKAIHYAERSRDFLLEVLEPFDLNRYFCTHCKEEVAPEDETCPRCANRLESGLIKRARKELKLLWSILEGLPRDYADKEAITSHLEQAREHVHSRSSAAARESLDKAKDLLEGRVGSEGPRAEAKGEAAEDGAGAPAREPREADVDTDVDTDVGTEVDTDMDVDEDGDGGSGDGADGGADPEGDGEDAP